MKWYFWVIVIVVVFIVLLSVTNMNIYLVSDSRLMIKTINQIEKHFDRWSIDGYGELSETELTIYAASMYNIEIVNGGLLQYFYNSSKYSAPYVSEALKNIGAIETEKAFSQFAADNDIDLYDLSEFGSESDMSYQELYEIYPFDEFDEMIIENYQNEDLDKLIAKYIREHISELN